MNLSRRRFVQASAALGVMSGVAPGQGAATVASGQLTSTDEQGAGYGLDPYGTSAYGSTSAVSKRQPSDYEDEEGVIRESAVEQAVTDREQGRLSQRDLLEVINRWLAEAKDRE